RPSVPPARHGGAGTGRRGEAGAADESRDGRGVLRGENLHRAEVHGAQRGCRLLLLFLPGHDRLFFLGICIDFKVKCITLNGTRVKLQIWDTAGQERFHTLSTSYFRGAQGFVLVYDITNLDSFQGVTSWMKDIHEKAGDEVDIVLLGNKCDKESERVVPKHKGEKLAWEHGIPFFETSAKDNVNIEDAFSVLTKEILEKKSWVLYDLDVVDLNESKKRTCCAF
uniref:small monomeric GTPase n=1 Tax=Gallus gallus TaxID=9031 RepID=A0A8V0XMC5_CHICK